MLCCAQARLVSKIETHDDLHGLCRRAEGAYALQLTLGALGALLADNAEGLLSSAVSFEAAMACVLRSDDRLIWNAALSLLALLSAHMPKQQLSQMLEVICHSHHFPPWERSSYCRAWRKAGLLRGSGCIAHPGCCSERPAIRGQRRCASCAHC